MFAERTEDTSLVELIMSLSPKQIKVLTAIERDGYLTFKGIRRVTKLNYLRTKLLIMDLLEKQLVYEKRVSRQRMFFLTERGKKILLLLRGLEI